MKGEPIVVRLLQVVVLGVLALFVLVATLCRDAVSDSRPAISDGGGRPAGGEVDCYRFAYHM